MRSLLLFVFLMLTVFGQDSAGVRSESPAARKRLSDAEQLILNGKDAAARDSLLKVLDEAGDDLILVEGGRYVAARWFTQRIMEKLPEDQKKLIRDRMDAPASTLLENGKRRRDAALLREVLEHYALSAAADEAANCLAELAAERGEYSLAIRFWNHVKRTPQVDARIAEAMVLSRQPLKPLIATEHDWPMLGATPERRGWVPGDLRLLSPSPAWEVPLPVEYHERPQFPRVRTVAIHPVMNPTHGIYATGSRVFMCELSSGKSSTIFRSHARQPQWHSVDFAVTAMDHRVFARVGAVSPSENTASRIVCLGSREFWNLVPPVKSDINANWDGAPLVLPDSVIASFSRIEGGRVISSLACYRDDSDKPVWVTDVCEFNTTTEVRERHELLTRAGSNLILVSQTGAIVAVNVRTGKPAWAYRYPRVLDGRFRDLGPAVSSQGRVFVAPNDSDRLFAFDDTSGEMLWQSERMSVDHIIGVAAGKVIAAIAGPQRGLRAYDWDTGTVIWSQHDDPALSTFGRGLIANDLIAWPTQAGLYLIQLNNGLPARPLLRGIHGNLAFSDGRLLVAGPRTLSLFRNPNRE